MLAGWEDKSAYALCVVSFAWDKNSPAVTFSGKTDGKIVQAQGPKDFGWDPIFAPDGFEGKTYAELDKAVKNSISHRGRAFDKLKEYLNKNIEKLQQQ